MLKRILSGALLVIILTGCVQPTAPLSNKIIQPIATPVVLTTKSNMETSQKGSNPNSTASPTTLPSSAPTVIPTPELVRVGPDNFPADVNPLTGLPAEDPSLLAMQPALVAVSNFPPSARPQTGLSLAPHVFEMTIGEGMTRFLAVFYGNYGQTSDVPAESTAIGPIRSGRLAFEDLRTIYQGFIVMAGASPEVKSQLSAVKEVYAKNTGNINSEAISITDLEKISQSRQTKFGTPSLDGAIFDQTSPANGETAQKLDVFWSLKDQVEWTYDAASGKYLRFQDKADGTGKFFPATDKLTGQQLAFDNVVVLAAEHDFQTPTRIDINLAYVIKEPAIFFRDGKAFKVYWTSLAPLGPIRFMDENGNPFPYKPGNTWFEVLSTITTTKQIEPGVWNSRFYNPG